MPKLCLWGILQKIVFSFSNSLSRRQGVIEVGRVNPEMFWESAGMNSPWWGTQVRQALRLLALLCPVTSMTLVLLLRIYIPGSLKGWGRRKGAQGVCQLRGQVVWGEAATNSHLHLIGYHRSTQPHSSDREEYKENMVCVLGHHVPHWELGFSSKQRRNKSSSTQ